MRGAGLQVLAPPAARLLPPSAWGAGQQPEQRSPNLNQDAKDEQRPSWPVRPGAAWNGPDQEGSEGPQSDTDGRGDLHLRLIPACRAGRILAGQNASAAARPKRERAVLSLLTQGVLAAMLDWK